MRTLRGPRRIAAAATAALALLLLAAAAPALAAAAPVTSAAGKTVVRFQDYTLAQGQAVRSVVVIRGNAIIGGTVARSVVVVDGTATIESTAVIGTDLAARDSSIVVVGGRLITEPGATIHGKTVRVAGFGLGGLLQGAASAAVVRPVGIIVGWWQLLFLPIVALVVAALFPHAVSRVSDRVHAKFWPSLGWGILGLLVSSVLLVVLAITIIGLLLVAPAVLALPAILLFCFVGAAALVGRLVLSSSPRYRDNVLVAAVVGALLVSLVSLVPIIGGLAVLVATVAGFGAALTLVNEWRLARRSTPAPAAGGPPPGSTPPGWTPYWTPPQGTPPQGTPQDPTQPGWAPQPPGWTSPPGWAPQPPPGWSWSPQQGWSPPAPGAGASAADAGVSAADAGAGTPRTGTPNAGATPQDSAEPPA
jgi:hypothetical protein